MRLIVYSCECRSKSTRCKEGWRLSWSSMWAGSAPVEGGVCASILLGWKYSDASLVDTNMDLYSSIAKCPGIVYV